VLAADVLLAGFADSKFIMQSSVWDIVTICVTEQSFNMSTPVPEVGENMQVINHVCV
jgi:hypothetical protein